MPTESNSIDCGRYLALLRAFFPAINGLSVFDSAAAPVSHTGDRPLDEEQEQELVRGVLQTQAPTLSSELEGGIYAQSIKLGAVRDEAKLVLNLYCSAGEGSAMPAIAGDPSFSQLSSALLACYQQHLELDAVVNELGIMADELKCRDRELDLLYKAEEQNVNIIHGREMLRQLVLNSSQILDVDVTYLYIPGSEISTHKYRDDNPVYHNNALLDALRGTVMPLLVDGLGTVAVNSEQEWRDLGIETALPFRLMACPLLDANGDAMGLLATASQGYPQHEVPAQDHNMLEVMAKKASRILRSYFDSLTGLENSHSFELIMKDLLRRSCGRGVSHSIANIDIDRMAVVNDISGHEAGDHLIKMVARKVSNMVRAHDQVARLGSDKIGVLLKNCDLMTARVIMKKVSYAVSSMDMEWDGKRHEISVSIGVAPISDLTQSVTGLLDAAETARNVSKQRGRNNIHLLEHDDSNLVRRKQEIRWVGRIQQALREDRFLLYAQLIEPMNARNGHRHYEVLLRLRDVDDTIVDPGSFLSAAENFYLMASLDRWVINQAFYQLAQMHRSCHKQTHKISINLSGQSLNDPYTLAGYIENKLEEYDIDGNYICFEITESTAIASLDEASLFIKQIRQLGCKFSLDDFGTGLSSFSYLKHLDVDYIKIDGSFVRDLVHDPVSESLVAAINQVGQAMQLETVAEYVENDRIRQKLISIGVNYGQGYAIGRPMPFSEVAARQEKTA